ncbi:hypothetical protein I314_01670 [Cryptococcus bacillisporus CA1873]|uniref:Uncharacterized protein n=1 Tax=Cryptococcus bacillisporus CA1873 TaxID=1296111 RepID=A0ABR5BG50_CRYGA|nr:hypothetical protein I314_01670 [Cryptococcus bacillisporus CA1873]|eukprot:KIR68176.1 hypothetical protein I314_01670 [Cryptococcus gattii CA1873]
MFIRLRESAATGTFRVSRPIPICIKVGDAADAFGTPSWENPSADIFAPPASNRQAKELVSTNKPCQARKLRPRILSYVLHKSITTPFILYMILPSKNEPMTVSVTKGPTLLPAKRTLICTAPPLTDQPNLTASFGSTKVVDAPVSMRNRMGQAGQGSLAGPGTDMARRG